MLTVRRSFCDHIACSTCMFVEQVAGLTKRHARRSPGLQAALVAIGLALAERAGSRLDTRLGVRVSRSTLLRDDPSPTGSTGRLRRVLGGDHFAAETPI